MCRGMPGRRPRHLGFAPMLGRVNQVGLDPDRGGGDHGQVVDVAAGDHPAERSPSSVTGEEDLAGQAGAGTADRVVRMLYQRIRVIRPCALCGAPASSRAGARVRWWSRSTPPRRVCWPRRTADGPRREAPSRCRPRLAGWSACRSSSTFRTAQAYRAVAHSRGTFTPPRSRDDDRSTAVTGPTPPASSARQRRTPRQRTRIASRRHGRPTATHTTLIYTPSGQRAAASAARVTDDAPVRGWTFVTNQ